ncbi:hypothetical protein KY362_04755 [Candidatus Woesearchaeota archaeon]|nr:hypothetical protein [Candidatus Woesearchaeota archaeon]
MGVGFTDKFIKRNDARGDLEQIIYTLGLSADIPVQMALETLGLRGRSIPAGAFDEKTYSRWYGEIMKTIEMRIFERYFEPEMHGAENIPSGGALLVSNHSGMWGWDGFAVCTQTYRKTGRAVMPLGFDQFARSDLCKSLGLIGRDPAKAVKLLVDNRLMFVCPGGVEEVSKPSTEAYKVQRVMGFKYGNWGYLKLAMAAQRPIVPIGVVGAEETHYNYGDMKAELDVRAGIAYELMPGPAKRMMRPLMNALGMVKKVPKLRNILPERSKIYVWAGLPIHIHEEFPGFDIHAYETLKTESEYPGVTLTEHAQQLYDALQEKMDQINQYVLGRIQAEIDRGLQYRKGIQALDTLARGQHL